MRVPPSSPWRKPRLLMGERPAFGSDEISSDELNALTRYLVWLRRLDRSEE